jgi:hypothetical protein
MIRFAELQDVKKLSELTSILMQQTQEFQNFTPNLKVARASLTKMIELPNAVILVTDDLLGLCIGLHQQLWFANEVVANSLLLGVKHGADPRYAKQLINAYVDWATAAGCHTAYASPAGGCRQEAIERLYSQCGFLRSGFSLVRRL